MAKAAPVVESLEGVPEGAREWYAPRDDGKFVLQLEGAPPGFVPAEYRDRVEEFRGRNSALSNQLTDLERRLKAYDGIEPDAAREALKAAQEHQKAVAEKKVLAAADVQQLIDAALKPALGRIQAAEERATQAEQALEARTVDEAIVTAARRQGDLHPGSEELLVMKARAAGWGSVDGALRQVVEGVPAYSRTHAGQPRGIDEWIAEEAVSQLGYLWKPSVGGGASNSRAPADPSVIDPSNREAFRANLEAIAKGQKKVGALQ